MISVQSKQDKGSGSKQAIAGSNTHHSGSAVATQGNNSSAVVTLSLSTSGNPSSSFYRGSNGNQQPIFSPIIPPQNQNYYNGVYCTQQGFSNSSSVSSPNFNGYGYDAAWTHEGHFAMHSNSISSESVRNIGPSLSDKGVLSYSNSAHSCCINKLGANDGVMLSSSLASSVYKSSVKEMEQHTKNGANSDPQLCLVNLSQQTPNSMYKCSEQVPPSSFPQINLYSLESNDFKYSAELPLMSNNSNDNSPKGIRSQSNVAKQSSKFCHVAKISNGESQACDQLSQVDLKQQENCVYSGQAASYSSEHLETYYLQGPFSFNVENNQPPYGAQRHTTHDENIYFANKAFPSPTLETQVGIGSRTLCHSDRPRSILDSSISSDLVRLDGYLHIDPKLMSGSYNQENYYNGKQSHHSVSGCDHEFQQQFSLNANHHMLATQLSQQLGCVHGYNGIKSTVTPFNDDRSGCEILDSVNGKDIDVLESEDGSSQESLSIAEEDDIIVEEEYDEGKDKYSNEEDGQEKVLQSEMKGLPKNRSCLVCNTCQSHSLQAFILVPIKNDSPVTSVSCLPVISKLNHILLRKNKSFPFLDDNCDDVSCKSFNGKYLCGNCLSLVERADDLEVKLGMIYQDLQCLYKKTSSLKKFSGEISFDGSECDKKQPDKVLSYNIVAANGNDTSSRKNIDINTSLESSQLKGVNEKLGNGKDSCEQSQGDHSKDIINGVVESEKNSNMEHEKLLDSSHTVDAGELQNDEDLKKQAAELHDTASEDKELKSEIFSLGDRNYVCDLCNLKFSRKESLVKHMQLHTGDFSYRCEHCKKGFSRRGSLVRHLTSRHSDGQDRRLYQCEQCGKCFTQEYHLQVHLRSHRGELRHKCETCGKAFASGHSLTIHGRTHTGEKPYSCELCSRPFSTQSNLKAHLLVCPKNHHDPESLPRSKVPAKPLKHTCSFCRKGFSKPSDLRVHLRSHTGEKPFVCERCGKRFCNSGNYNQHARLHCGKNKVPTLTDKNDEEQPPVDREVVVANSQDKCESVEETVGSAGKTVEDNDEAEALSGKGSSLSDVTPSKVLFNLNENKRLHKCKICGKEFSRKGALACHTNRHEGLKPYSCDVCDKAFPDRSNLIKHKTLHSEVKPFKCGVCGKSFRSSLKVHMRVHNGEKPFTCSICNQKFTVKSSLMVHCKKYHMVEVKEVSASS